MEFRESDSLITAEELDTYGEFSVGDMVIIHTPYSQLRCSPEDAKVIVKIVKLTYKVKIEDGLTLDKSKSTEYQIQFYCPAEQRKLWYTFYTSSSGSVYPELFSWAEAIQRIEKAKESGE